MRGGGGGGGGGGGMKIFVNIFGWCGWGEIFNTMTFRVTLK